jgi:DNA-binding NarL/FixJ family response regulator
VLDDHEIVRRGLRELLESEGDIVVVGEAGLVADAIPAILELRPDVAILDGRLPDGSGVEVCREVRTVDASIKGLILTSYDDDQAMFAAILAGAAGYVLKEIDGTSLLSGVRAVAHGHSLIGPAVTGRMMERIRNGSAGPAELATLTVQENSILELIAEGLTNRQIGEPRRPSRTTSPACWPSWASSAAPRRR